MFDKLMKICLASFAFVALLAFVLMVIELKNTINEEPQTENVIQQPTNNIIIITN